MTEGSVSESEPEDDAAYIELDDPDVKPMYDLSSEDEEAANILVGTSQSRITPIGLELEYHSP